MSAAAWIASSPYARALATTAGFVAVRIALDWLLDRPFERDTGECAIGVFFGYLAGWRASRRIGGRL